MRLDTSCIFTISGGQLLDFVKLNLSSGAQHDHSTGHRPPQRAACTKAGKLFKTIFFVLMCLKLFILDLGFVFENLYPWRGRLRHYDAEMVNFVSILTDGAENTQTEGRKSASHVRIDSIDTPCTGRSESHFCYSYLREHHLSTRLQMTIPSVWITMAVQK